MSKKISYRSLPLTPSQEVLFNQYLDFAKQNALLAGGESNFEDYYSIALERLWLSCKYYNPKKAVNFKTYFITSFRGGLALKFHLDARFNNVQRNKKRCTGFKVLSLDGLAEDDQKQVYAISDKSNFVNDLEFKHNLDRVSKFLSNRWVEVLKLIHDGYNNIDIAKMLGYKNRFVVAMTIKRINLKLQSLGVSMF